MRDEGVARRKSAHDLRHLLPGHEVYTTAYMGWSSLANADLLSEASGKRFDVVITQDAGVEYEQHLPTLPIAVVILRAKTNRLVDIRPLLENLLSALDELRPRTVVTVG